ncbi:hypothetical protein, partial [Streptomyces sp. WAC05292]|uniref:hypothetical protein n=1 Tax=Streptomyces sp. WAC05292 TaxID=2487418 RepID=UPI00163CF3B3
MQAGPGPAVAALREDGDHLPGRDGLALRDERPHRLVRGAQAARQRERQHPAPGDRPRVVHPPR